MAKWNVEGEKGHSQLESTRKKISVGMKKHKKTPEHQAKITKALKGRVLTEEWKNKISNAHIGMKCDWNKYPRTEQTKEKLRQYRGEKASNWRGGISFNPYPLGWNKTHREQIRYRDGYVCQFCGIPEAECLKRLSVHHIDYDKDNIKEDNLISLCTRCHSKTNYNRKYWRELWQTQKLSA